MDAHRNITIRARSPCDLDLEGSHRNFARDSYTKQYLNSTINNTVMFGKRIYFKRNRPVTLTLKVATGVVPSTILILPQTTKLWHGNECGMDGRTMWRLYSPPIFFWSMKIKIITTILLLGIHLMSKYIVTMSLSIPRDDNAYVLR